MAHIHPRHLLPVFQRKLQQWPVVSLLGPRQCGKSTFLKQLAFPSLTNHVLSLDKATQRRSAQANPELFLKSHPQEPLVLDEVQKVPELFDEIKALVDEQRRPGRFVLSGSARFSSKLGVRESLTGRTAVLYLDSLTLGETLPEPPPGHRTPSLEEISRYLDFGGMPASCFSRDPALRSDYWEEWLDTLCEQDLHAFSKGRLSGDLAREILGLICTIDEPSISELARKTGTHSRRIQNHLQSLEDLFVVHRVEPGEDSTGKARYHPFDCGLASALGADWKTRVRTLLLHQRRNHDRFLGVKPRTPRYFQHRKGAFFDLAETSASGERVYVKLETAPFPSRREIQKAVAQSRRFSRSKIIFLCPTEEQPMKIEKYVEVRPISSIFEARSSATPW